MGARGWQLTIDANDPAGLAAFWCEALGYVLQPPPDGFDDWPTFLATVGFPQDEFDSASAIVDPDGVQPRIFLQGVPETKAGKNRLHVDIRVAQRTDDAATQTAARLAERDRLVALGASEVGIVEEHGEHWIVMQDPEGNEFCIS